MTQRDVVFPAGRRALYERNRYSPAIRANGFLFVSGQVGSREDGSPEPDLEKQVRLAFSNLNAILLAAGCTFDNVVDVTVFIVDPEARFERIWKVIPEFWGDAPHPTLTGIGVTGYMALISRSRSSPSCRKPPGTNPAACVRSAANRHHAVAYIRRRGSSNCWKNCPDTT